MELEVVVMVEWNGEVDSAKREWDTQKKIYNFVIMNTKKMRKYLIYQGVEAGTNHAIVAFTQPAGCVG